MCLYLHRSSNALEVAPYWIPLSRLLPSLSRRVTYPKATTNAEGKRRSVPVRSIPIEHQQTWLRRPTHQQPSRVRKRNAQCRTNRPTFEPLAATQTKPQTGPNSHNTLLTMPVTIALSPISCVHLHHPFGFASLLCVVSPVVIVFWHLVLIRRCDPTAIPSDQPPTRLIIITNHHMQRIIDHRPTYDNDSTIGFISSFTSVVHPSLRS